MDLRRYVVMNDMFLKRVVEAYFNALRIVDWLKRRLRHVTGYKDTYVHRVVSTCTDDP